MNENIPSEFLCPISNKLLKNPVTDSEGMTYEKDEILKHLITNSSSPITGKPLKISDLVPNFPLKIAIETQIKNFEAQKFSLKGMAQEKHILKWDFNPSVFSINIGVLLDSFETKEKQWEMYRSKLNSAGVKEFLQYELKFMNELYSKIKSFKDFECYAQSEPAEALQLQLGELKKNKQCIDFFFSSSKILTVENLNKYSGSLLNDKSEEYIFTNLFFHILKEIALGATFLFQKILYLYVTSPTKNENLFEKIYNMALTKKFASFFMFCQNFFSGLFSKIWQDMEKNIFNDAQKHYLFTFMLLDVTTNTEKSCEKDKFWTIFLDELSQYKDVYCMQALDLENNEVFQEVHENLIKFFKTTTNPNILETFYLACQPNEVLKTNDKLLDDFWKNPQKQHLLRQKIIEEYLPKQIYSTEFKNKQLVALTVSKGYILLNKSYTYKGNSKGKKFVYMAKLFLIILHEILHKIRLLENSNCLLDLETEKKLGVYDFRGNLIDYIDEKNAFTIFDIGNFETEKISIIQKLFHELNEKLESQQNLKKKYECRNRYWKCRPGISLETDSDEEERETDQEWS